MKSVLAAVAPASATVPRLPIAIVSTMPEQLIAEHLHGNGKRKAPERGAYLGVIDDHGCACVTDVTVERSSARKNASISSSVV